MTIDATSDGTVGKAFTVLEQVASFGRPVRFGDVLEQSPFPKATLYRLMQTLVGVGALSYDDKSQTYRVGLKLVGLAHSAWRQSSLAPIARTELDKLASFCGETVHLAQLDGGQVLYVDKRNATRPVDMISETGKVGPAYCTGVGKVMLAFLDEVSLEPVLQKQAFFQYTPQTITSSETLIQELRDIRTNGVAYDREEHEPQIICIAAPVLSSQKRVLGAISITASTRHQSFEELERFRDALLQAAQEIGCAAEVWQFPV